MDEDVYVELLRAIPEAWLGEDHARDEYRHRFLDLVVAYGVPEVAAALIDEWSGTTSPER